MKKTFVVAIDGHAGCGKSSICSEASKQNSWVYISTGALYRGLAYLARTRNIQLENHENLEHFSLTSVKIAHGTKKLSLFFTRQRTLAHTSRQKR